MNESKSGVIPIVEQNPKLKELEQKISSKKIEVKKYEELQDKLNTLLKEIKEKIKSTINETLGEDINNEDTLSSFLMKELDGGQMLIEEGFSIEGNIDANKREIKELEIEMEVRKELGPNASEENIKELVDNRFGSYLDNL